MMQYQPVHHSYLVDFKIFKIFEISNFWKFHKIFENRKSENREIGHKISKSWIFDFQNFVEFSENFWNLKIFEIFEIKSTKYEWCSISLCIIRI